MKKLLIIIVLSVSIQSGQAQFMRMPLNYPHDGSYYSPNVMSIVDQDHVWIASQRQNYTTLNMMPYSKAVKTTDGGNTWQFFQIPIIGSPCLVDVEAQSDSICYYVVDDLNIVNSSIWKTIDGGSSWLQKTPPQFLVSFGDFIHLFGKDTLIAVGDPADGYFDIQITNDGGDTWTRVPQSNIPSILTGEAGIGGKTSFSVVGNTIWFSTTAGRCFKSNDAGYHWTVTNVNSNTGFQLSHVCFSDLQHGIFYTKTLSQPLQYFITSNGGQSWTIISLLPNLINTIINSVGGIFEGFLVAGWVNTDTTTYIYYTNDFFASQNFVASVSYSSNYIYFKNAYTGWLSGGWEWEPDNNIYKFTGVLMSIQGKHIGQENIKITPNPTCQSSLITFPSEFLSDKKTIRVFSVSGKLIREYFLPSQVRSIELNASEYSNGIYNIELISHNGIIKNSRWAVLH